MAAEADKPKLGKHLVDKVIVKLSSYYKCYTLSGIPVTLRKGEHDPALGPM